MPFCHFIDGLLVEKCGELIVEAVLTLCLWFNRKTKNRASAWCMQGFMGYHTLFHDRKNYVRNDKLQDYHNMMSQIFKESYDH